MKSLLPFTPSSRTETLRRRTPGTRSRLLLAGAAAAALSALPAPAHADAAFHYLARLGFYGTQEYNNPWGGSTTYVSHYIDGFVYTGTSDRFNYGSNNGNAAWAATADGVSRRIGLYSTREFSTYSNLQVSEIKGLSANGYVAGTSYRYDDNSNNNGKAAWIANGLTGETTRVGLYQGAEFTSSTNQQTSEVVGITSTGYAAGTSIRYNGATNTGLAAWVADSTGTTTRIGFYDQGGGNEFTNGSGIQRSEVSQVTADGYIAGTSLRYKGSTFDGYGQALWIANAATGATTRIGLYQGSEFHTSNDYQYSFYDSGNSTGVGPVTGITQRFNNSASTWTSYGYATWAVNHATGETLRTGLYDQGGGNEFTSSTGSQQSQTNLWSAAGVVGGYTYRYNGTSTQLGYAAWIANVNTGLNTRVGFYDQGGGNTFTSDTGYQFSFLGSMNATGYASGSSNIYNGGSTQLGSAAWFTNPDGVTTRVGFTDGAYTADNGAQLSGLARISTSGYMAGMSARYSGTNQISRDAWVGHTSNPTALTRVGLYDQGGGNTFTSSSGQQYSDVSGVLNNGTAFGTALIFHGGSSDSGTATWAASPTGTSTRIGLYDQAGGNTYTSDTGYQYSYIGQYNDNGFITGTSYRYNGESDQYGQTAWLYNSSTNETVGFDMSVRASDGYGVSSIVRLLDDGSALGTFNLFNGDTDLGQRSFAYLIGIGTFILDESVDVNLASLNWQNLGTAFALSQSGLLLGAAQTNNLGYGAYLLQATAVPEPSTWVLIGLGVAAFLVLHIRRRSRRQDA
ncbi:PEP-CTERM protein-sorting domain-containing protein [Terrimicrobium sacchariphilum]|uniref:PEP-CTERM protein-sorting domain-containing protein n=2 Tax=Terrimicrobium sacchariphilum TaxID=690879 RepID=A0A146G659_TERSA|nr:PEP-CTERM protein-sorting domain-containing protein [Terrimicrobium sacchariphilum]